MQSKTRNLLIELHQPEQRSPQASLVNNWTRPPPLQFHLLHSPALTHQLALIAHQQRLRPAHSPSPEQLRKHQPPRKQGQRGLHGDRIKYQRFEQQLQFLQQFLLQFKDLRGSQVLAYRQTLLFRYLSELVAEINAECREKAHFLQSIWNAFIRIFEEVFERLVSDCKSKEKQSLKDSISLHEEYQNRLEVLTRTNLQLKAEQAKSSAVIEQLANNIAVLNVELKGARALQEKSALALKELTQKYEELRAEYIQLASATNCLSWAEVENRLQDQELLLFSKKVANSEIAVKVKPKAKRRGRALDNKIEVQLLLQELQAESEYSFSLNSSLQEQQRVSYVDKKVQTVELKRPQVQATDQSMQCQRSFAQTAQAQAQTTFDKRKGADCESQTNYKGIPPEIALKLVSCLNINARMQFSFQIDEKPACSEPSEIFTPGMKMEKIEDAELASSQKNVSPADLSKSKVATLGRERSSGKMFRVGEGSKLAKRGSNIYRQKQLKTEGASDSQSQNHPLKRQSSQKKVSQLLLIEQVRQEYLRNYSRFRTTKPSPGAFRMQQALEESTQLGPNGQNAAGPSRMIENTQFSSVYSGLIEKIKEAMGGERRKKVAAGKSLKQAGCIFKMVAKFVSQGVFSLDIVQIGTEYLSAIEGKHLSAELKQKKFIQFILSCIPLAPTSYLIKSLLLLCGMPFGRSYYLQKSREDDKLAKDSSRYVFSSEVYAYFKLLALANCSQNDEMLEAFTTEERLLGSLQALPVLYKGSSSLLEDIKLSIRQSTQQSLEQNPRLDIFKSLHLVIDKILAFKANIIHALDPLVALIRTPDLSFATHIIALLTERPNARMLCLHLLRTLYTHKYTASNLGTVAVIEGLQISTFRFAAIEQEHKFTILKKLMTMESHKDRLLQAMVKAIPKKELRKQQFLIMLSLLWSKQADRLIDDILGEDLILIYNLGVELNMETPHRDSFHSLAFDHLFQ